MDFDFEKSRQELLEACGPVGQKFMEMMPIERQKLHALGWYLRTRFQEVMHADVARYEPEFGELTRATVTEGMCHAIAEEFGKNPEQRRSLRQRLFEILATLDIA